MLDRNTVKTASDTVRAKLASDDPNTAVGVAVGAVLVGALGLAVLNPFGVGATADTRPDAQVAAGAAHAPEAAKKAGAGKKSAPKKLTSSAAAIKLAMKQVGIREGSNGQTKFHDWYIGTNEAKLTAKRDGGRVAQYNGAAWCNMFVSWVGAQTGVKGMGWDAYTVQHAKWLEKQGRWGQTAKPGALVFFDWQNGSSGGIGGIDHVGMVVKDNGDGTVSTVEGNISNSVVKKTRSKSSIVGYGYPDYADYKKGPSKA
ncbi:CHAP domain-containing protein [Spirillospora sp. NPDC047279]|uniref:CHAP domain-containing protein n=1 Tax=Spirillospora sp. NPDC047279 TaxID=3155478 RepID=UPI0033DA775E